MERQLYIFCLFCFIGTTLYPQNNRVDGMYGSKTITLEEVIDSICIQSPSAKMERFNFQNELLQYENYKKSFLPAIEFSFNPVNFNRSLNLMQHPENGTYSYVEDFSNSSGTGVTIRQKLGPTGGIFTAGSKLNFFSEFSRNRSNFNTTPFTLGYSQQLVGGNKNYKLEKKIEAKKNEESVKQFCTNISNIQYQSLNLFMEAFSSKLELDVSYQNLNATDTLLQIAKIRLNNGGITEYEYKQVELLTINNKYTYEDACKTYDETLQRLITFLGLELDIKDIEIKAPEFNLPVNIDLVNVIFYVDKNNPFALSQEIRRLEAEKNLYSIKLSNRFNGNINLNYGVNQYAETLISAYRKPDTQQSVIISFQIPVFQWGINKNKVKMAENNYQASLINIEKEKSEFNNELKNKVNRYNHNVNLKFIAEQAYNLSQEQYKMLIHKFSLNKASVYELVTVQQEQASAMQQHYTAIKNVWNSYFILRNMTLFDFTKDKELIDILVSNT